MGVEVWRCMCVGVEVYVCGCVEVYVFEYHEAFAVSVCVVCGCACVHACVLFE